MARGREFSLFWRILLFAAVVPLLFRLRVERLQQLLFAEPCVTSSDEQVICRIAELTELALRRGRLFVKNSCLTRGATQCYFMRKAGADVSLIFGIDLAGSEGIGHCWLERDSLPFLEKHDPRLRFTEMFRIPGLSRSG